MAAEITESARSGGGVKMPGRITTLQTIIPIETIPGAVPPKRRKIPAGALLFPGHRSRVLPIEKVIAAEGNGRPRKTAAAALPEKATGISGEKERLTSSGPNGYPLS